jgi:acyl-CoA oxidase
VGCFCFTELGYGNNAPKMETTATYDETTQTFTINCPTTLSQKYWITNGACHANYAVVFAQTIVKGKNEGVNAFLVPIRKGNPVDNLNNMDESTGVTIEDMGIKMSLNGIDNGRLFFKNVKVPRSALLDKLNQVTEDGTFISKQKKNQVRDSSRSLIVFSVVDFALHPWPWVRVR